jgi:hypothetical protein
LLGGALNATEYQWSSVSNNYKRGLINTGVRFATVFPRDTEPDGIVLLKNGFPLNSQSI